jgi:hypothetical protein
VDKKEAAFWMKVLIGSFAVSALIVLVSLIAALMVILRP